MKNITKKIAILLRISGIYTILRVITALALMPLLYSHWEIQYVDVILFFLDISNTFFRNSLISFFVFYVFCMSVTLIIVADFAFASNKIIGHKAARRLATYRSLLTCLFGIFLIILGPLVSFPNRLNPLLFIIEGSFYFFFYGTIFTLLMINKRKEG